jgi:hypothetical protein
VLAKLANRQYVLINLLEAPVLALVMAFFLRYYRTGHGAEGYVFRHNDNIPQFLFIAVIVALFLGLTVAAEEIIRDRKILQRERFLDLSRTGYLIGKTAILFGISAIQSFLFVLVANHVLDIRGMFLTHWIILFSTSCFANVLGLNVSASFNSAKVIYILIPVLIIPQLLFSGIIVRFDKLHPLFADQKSVPWIGNIMASRWAYEGMATAQFADNAYERPFFAIDQRMKTANWKKDLWVRDLQDRSAEVRRALGRLDQDKDARYDLDLLRNELVRESRRISGLDLPSLDLLTPGSVTPAVLDRVDAVLQQLVLHYRNAYKQAEREKEAMIAEMTSTAERKAAYFALLDAYRNESLADFATNRNDVNLITEYRGELVRKSDPIYLEPIESGFFGAQFYAPGKYLLGLRIPTWWANLLVIWGMTLLLAIALQFELLPRLVQRFSGPPGR